MMKRNSHKIKKKVKKSLPFLLACVKMIRPTTHAVDESPTKRIEAIRYAQVGKTVCIYGFYFSSLYLLMKQVIQNGVFWILICIPILITVIAAFALLALVLSTVLFTNPKKPWSAAGDLTSNFSWDGKRPLRITFITWGSRGDVQPNVSLGLELARRGHTVRVMGMECFRSCIDCHPELEYIPMEDDFMFKLGSELNEPQNRDKLPAICAKFVGLSFRVYVSQYIKAAEDSDIIIGQNIPICNLAHLTVSQVVKKPIFFVTHDAMNSMPNTTYSYDPSTNRVKDYGWLMNIINTRALPLIVGAMATMSPWSDVRRYRRELGLSTPWPFMELLGPRIVSSIPTFATWDPSLWPRPKDFSSHWISTGFFVTKSSCVHDEEGVLEWLKKRSKDAPGRRTIYAALGSFGHHDKTFYTDMLLDASQKLGLDVVTLSSSVDNRPMPANVFVAKNVPQDKVFPQCDFIVHHGGAGTASQVIRSGKPGVCIPAMHFQETWGARLKEYGAGVMITQTELEAAYQTRSTNLLLEAFEAAMQPKIREKAECLGEAARQAGGVELAADKIFEYLNDS